jgi:hypothetical protein
MRKLIAVVFAALTLAVAVGTAAYADPTPPTNGGNGGGQSGQCTGNPDDRPEVCPAT